MNTSCYNQIRRVRTYNSPRQKCPVINAHEYHVTVVASRDQMLCYAP